MAGINIYEERKIPTYYGTKGLSDKDNPCVFLSHISIDKNAVLKIAEFIKNSDINIYLDIADQELQRAVIDDKHEKITECIDKGIESSTHILCLVSEQTKNSWWVPYEIGYAKKGKKTIGTMKLKQTTSLPSFLLVPPILPVTGVSDLQKFLKPLVKTKSIGLSSGYTDYKPLFEHFEITQR